MIKQVLDKLVLGHSLTFEEAAKVMEEIMTGEATPAQFAAFVTALRIKKGKRQRRLPVWRALCAPRQRLSQSQCQ